MMKRYSILFISLFFWGCMTNKPCAYKEVIGQYIESNKIEIVKQDQNFLNWIESSTNMKPEWEWAIRVKNDTGRVKEYYSDNIFLKGKMNNEGKRSGIWKGYYNDKIIIETAYLVMNNQSSPTYVKFWNKEGEFIEELNFSIIR